MMQEALKYLNLGWSVIPLKPKTKVPLLDSWSKYQNTLPTKEEIVQWWGHSPTANVGIVTGAVSGLVVVDLEHEGLAEADRLGIRSSISSITGKGKHLYFKHPGEKVCNAVALNKIKGLDIRADGGYVLAPPSIHPNGKRYTWQTPLFQSMTLPTFPKEELFTPKTNTGSSETQTSLQSQNGKVDWVSEALEGLTNGNRDITFTRIIGKLHRDKWSASAIRSILKDHSDRVGFPLSELDKKIASVQRYSNDTNHRASEGTGPMAVRTFSNSLEDYRTRKAARATGIELPTGFKKLDRLTGGLKRQEIFTVAARTGTGKTNWLLGISKNLCRQGRSVLFFSTEMSYDTIWDRYISALEPSEVFESHRFIVCDDFTPNIERIESTIREVMPDVYIFDHINHVGEEHQEIAVFMQGLKRLARTFNIPGIVAAQLNRLADWTDAKTNERVIPRISMIKGSGTIEQVSAQVLLLSETSVQPDQNEIIGNLDKNRYGEKDLVDFVLRKNPYRLEEVE